MDLVCVIMKGEDNQRFADTKSLLNYAFDNFELIRYDEMDNGVSDKVGKALDPGTELCENGYLLAPKGMASRHITSEFIASGGEGNVIGTRTWFYDGTKVGSSQVKLTDATVQKLSQRAKEAESWKVEQNAKSKSERSNMELAVFFLIGGVLLLLIFILLGMVRQNRRRKRAAKRRAQMQRERAARQRRARQNESRGREPYRRDRR